jgi:flagellar basal body-associated protein FliL
MDKPRSEVSKRSMKKLILLAGLVFTFSGVGAWALSSSPWLGDIRKLKPIRVLFSVPVKESRPVHSGHIYRMDPFVVNLNDENAMRYLKIKIEIESNQEDETPEYASRLPQLRDATLTILSGKNHKEIMSAEGKKDLKEELMERFNRLLRDFRVQKIYFTEFIIQ